MNETRVFSRWRSLSVFVLAISILPLAEAQESRNKLPKRQHKSSNAPFLKPAEAVRTMSIPKGFDVSVFAAEPDIAEPIAFCFDDRGRLWVAENLNYRTRRQHPGDKVSRIQILEDTNGDGFLNLGNGDGVLTPLPRLFNFADAYQPFDVAPLILYERIIE